MKSFKQPEEWSNLLNGMADDSLTVEQEQRFVELLRSEADFRREYVRFCQLLTQLTWELSAEPEGQPKLEGVTVSTAVEQQTRRTPTGRIRFTPVHLAAVGIVAAVLLIGFVWLAFAPDKSTSPEVVAAGHVTAIDGRISIHRDGQAPIMLRKESAAQWPWPLESHDRVSVGPGSSGTLTLADGTRLELRPETDVIVKVENDVTIELIAGSLRAQVAQQPPGHALRFVTPRSNVNVLGTVLELLTQDAVDEVAVEEGLVQVSRKGDARTANVAAGQYLSVPDRGELLLTNWPQPADVWVEDFEQGLPPGWIGRPVDDDLPAHSKMAVQAVAVPDVFRLRQEIRSPLAPNGLFAWRTDSVLHVTYRVQPPGWFHIYLLARTYGDPQPVLTYCCVKPELWRQHPGDWQTITLPLSEFRRIDSDGSEPTLGRIPLQISFSGPAGLDGVVIDRIQIRRETLPKEESNHANVSE